MPDRPGSPSRRSVLRAVPAVASAGLAGCAGLLGGDGDAEAEPTPTPTATPELPNLERRVVQRDKAAITHIFSVVTGTVEWPELEVVAVVQEALLGSWETDTERLTLNADATFELEGSDGSYNGAYAVRDDTLTFAFESGETVSYRWNRRETADGQRLELSQDGQLQVRYRFASGPGEIEFTEVIEGLHLQPMQGGSTQQQALETGSSGSGFVVSPDGYVVTNAHVVLADQEPERMLYQRLARLQRQVIRQEIAQDEDIDEDQRARVGEILLDKMLRYFVDNAALREVEESFHVLNGVATPEEDIRVESWDAEIVRAGEVVIEVDGEESWGQDIALLSVDQTDLQSVTLGDASSLSTGDDIFVIGYPDIGQLRDLFEDRNRALEPTLTSGVVSARRTMNSGVEAIQTDAAINGGNSGGPMYDSNGEVVGVATFSPTEYRIEQIEFGLPIDAVTSMLEDAGVENESGELDTAFDDGIEAYWRGDCETTVDRMHTVLEINSDHPYAQQYVDDCEAGEAPGQ